MSNPTTDHAPAPTPIDALVSQAKAQHQAGRLAQADGLYGRALSMDPGHAEALHYRGILLHQTGRDEEAAALIAKAVERQPDHARALNNLGLVLKALGRFDEAVNAITRAAEADPTSADARFDLATVFQATRDFDKAQAAYRRAMELGPDLAEAPANLGALLTGLGRPSEALEVLTGAARRFPAFAPVQHALAETLHALERYEEALAACRRALELDPTCARAHLQHGETLAQLGRLTDGIAAYRRSVDLDPALAHDPGRAIGKGEGVEATAPRYVDVVERFHVIAGSWALPGFDPETTYLLPINPLIEAAADKPTQLIAFDQVGFKDSIVSIARLAEADTAYPCIALVDAPNPSNRKYRLIDGNHRIHKLICEGKHETRFHVFELDQVRRLIKPRSHFYRDGETGQRPVE